MLYDPDNPVVQICAQGIEKEYAGELPEAAGLYRQAWEQASSPLELLTAAHYLARVQPDPAEALRWNLTALGEAAGVTGLDIGSVYPSLYLNVGQSMEMTGDGKNAWKYYSLAAEASAALGDDGYGEMIRKGIAAALDRTGPRG
jgi:rifampin ADP-ribosylating transferase